MELISNNGYGMVRTYISWNQAERWRRKPSLSTANNELSEILGGAGGQAGSSQLEQKPITPTVLAKQVRPIWSIGQIGTEPVRPVLIKDA